MLKFPKAHCMIMPVIRHGILKRATSSIKPHLTDTGMQKLVDFCKSHVEADGCFGDLMNKVHVDEKWYYCQQVDEKCYLMSNVR
jgi:hypothetical protein